MEKKYHSKFLNIGNNSFQLLTNNENIISILSKRWCLTTKPNPKSSHLNKLWIDYLINRKALRLTKDANTSFIDALDFIIQATIEKYLNKHNYFLLHGGSVKIRNKAYAFIGPSGSGKSTLLSRLSDCSVLAEDTIIIERKRDRYYIIPSVFDKKYVDFKCLPLILAQINCLKKSLVDKQSKLSSASFLSHLVRNNLFLLEKREQVATKIIYRLLISTSMLIPGYCLCFKKSGKFNFLT